MTVVELKPERPRVELVPELLTDVGEPGAALLADPGHAVHQRGMDAVEVNRVRMRPGVHEVDPQEIALART
jgi:hypothetical protein